MNIYKLNYLDKETAIADLKAKRVYDEDLNYNNGIHAVVEIGLIVLEQGTYDEESNVITGPIFADGYHYDIMTEEIIDFGLYEIQVNNPKHTFAGY